MFHLQGLSSKRNTAEITSPSIEYASGNPLGGGTITTRPLFDRFISIPDDAAMFWMAGFPLSMYFLMPFFIYLVPKLISGIDQRFVQLVIFSIISLTLFEMILAITAPVILYPKWMPFVICLIPFISTQFAFPVVAAWSFDVPVKLRQWFNYHAFSTSSLLYDWGSRHVHSLVVNVLARPIQVLSHLFGPLHILAQEVPCAVY